MNVVLVAVAYLLFPGGLFVVVGSLAYEYVDRKLVARFQNRVGPRWFQPLADLVKLLVKEEIVPAGGEPRACSSGCPLRPLRRPCTAALYVPMAGLSPTWGFRGRPRGHRLPAHDDDALHRTGGGQHDGPVLPRRRRPRAHPAFLLRGAVPPGAAGTCHSAGTWRIAEINGYAQGHLWMIVTQPLGFLVALIGLMGKLELPPFDAPEAETEIVSGALTEYSGRGLAFFRLGRDIELFVGLTLISAFYLGGLANPLQFLLKTLALLFVTAGLQSLFARLRIDQTVGLWWRDRRAAGPRPAPHPDRPEDPGGRPMMRIASMLSDVMRSLFKQPFTERYPFVVRPAPERTRGKLVWDGAKCTGCMLCVQGLPGGGHRDQGRGPGGKEVHLPLPHRPVRLLRAVRGELQAGRPFHVQRAVAFLIDIEGVVQPGLR